MAPTSLATRDRLQRREIPELPAPPRLSNLPAWLLSVLLHVCLIVSLSVLWVSRPSGTGSEPDRPVGVAVVYETSGGESYFLETPGAAQVAASEDTQPSESLTDSLPSQSAAAAASLESALSGLLPEAGLAGVSASQAAGGLGLGEGGAVLGGDREVPKAKTTVFGIEGEGTRFLYVFDRSESMQGYGGAPLRAAKSELLKSIQSLGPVHQFQVIFYNDSPLPFGGMGTRGPQLFKGDDPSKQAAMRFVRDVSADGGTRHIDALRMALAMAPDVLFFLTDADSSPSAREIEDLQTRAIRTGTTIHSIQFGSGANPSNAGWIQRMSSETGGKYRYINVAGLSPNE
jgi:hypothetical protein